MLPLREDDIRDHHHTAIAENDKKKMGRNAFVAEMT